MIYDIIVSSNFVASAILMLVSTSIVQISSDLRLFKRLARCDSVRIFLLVDLPECFFFRFRVGGRKKHTKKPSENDQLTGHF